MGILRLWAPQSDGSVALLPDVWARVVDKQYEDVLFPAEIVDCWVLIPQKLSWWSQTLGVEILRKTPAIAPEDSKQCDMQSYWATRRELMPASPTKLPGEAKFVPQWMQNNVSIRSLLTASERVIVRRGATQWIRVVQQARVVPEAMWITGLHGENIGFDTENELFAGPGPMNTDVGLNWLLVQGSPEEDSHVRIGDVVGLRRPPTAAELPHFRAIMEIHAEIERGMALKVPGLDLVMIGTIEREAWNPECVPMREELRRRRVLAFWNQCFCCEEGSLFDRSASVCTRSEGCNGRYVYCAKHHEPIVHHACPPPPQVQWDMTWDFPELSKPFVDNTEADRMKWRVEGAGPPPEIYDYRTTTGTQGYASPHPTLSEVKRAHPERLHRCSQPGCENDPTEHGVRMCKVPFCELLMCQPCCKDGTCHRHDPDPKFVEGTVTTPAERHRYLPQHLRRKDKRVWTNFCDCKTFVPWGQGDSCAICWKPPQPDDAGDGHEDPTGGDNQGLEECCTCKQMRYRLFLCAECTEPHKVCHDCAADFSGISFGKASVKCGHCGRGAPKDPDLEEGIRRSLENNAGVADDPPPGSPGASGSGQNVPPVTRTWSSWAGPLPQQNSMQETPPLQVAEGPVGHVEVVTAVILSGEDKPDRILLGRKTSGKGVGMLDCPKSLRVQGEYRNDTAARAAKQQAGLPIPPGRFVDTTGQVENTVDRIDLMAFLLPIEAEVALVGEGFAEANTIYSWWSVEEARKRGDLVPRLADRIDAAVECAVGLVQEENKEALSAEEGEALRQAETEREQAEPTNGPRSEKDVFTPAAGHLYPNVESRHYKKAVKQEIEKQRHERYAHLGDRWFRHLLGILVLLSAALWIPGAPSGHVTDWISDLEPLDGAKPLPARQPTRGSPAQLKLEAHHLLR